MTDPPVSRHAEVVAHLHRHTELRRRAAEEAVRAATEPSPEEGDEGGDETGG